MARAWDYFKRERESRDPEGSMLQVSEGPPIYSGSRAGFERIFASGMVDMPMGDEPGYDLKTAFRAFFDKLIEMESVIGSRIDDYARPVSIVFDNHAIHRFEIALGTMDFGHDANPGNQFARWAKRVFRNTRYSGTPHLES